VQPEQFPYVYRFIINLTPLAPVPTSFRCTLFPSLPSPKREFQWSFFFFFFLRHGAVQWSKGQHMQSSYGSLARFFSSCRFTERVSFLRPGTFASVASWSFCACADPWVSLEQISTAVSLGQNGISKMALHSPHLWIYFLVFFMPSVCACFGSWCLWRVEASQCLSWEPSSWRCFAEHFVPRHVGEYLASPAWLVQQALWPWWQRVAWLIHCAQWSSWWPHLPRVCR
jgi:hypothetical protein